MKCKYVEIYCDVCGEKTRHVEIDDFVRYELVKIWQCEICGDKRAFLSEQEQSEIVMIEEADKK